MRLPYHAVAQEVIGVSVGAGGNGCTLFLGQVIGQEVGRRMSNAALPAEPFAASALIVVTVEGQAIAMGAEIPNRGGLG